MQAYILDSVFTMKRTLLYALIIMWLTPCVSFAVEVSLNNIAYKVDTVEYYPVGPGTDYLKVRFTRADNASSMLNTYILQVDTRNPYVSIKQELGKNKIVGSERPSSMAERITTSTHVAFAGTNGDFFVTSGDVGLPVGLTIENSEFGYLGSTSRRVGAVTAEGKPFVAANWKYSGRLYTAGNKDTLVIKHVNYTRQADELVLYNQLQGVTTGTNQYGTELLVELCEGEQWKTNGRQKVIVKSKQSNVGSMTIPAGQAVLSGHGEMQKALDSLVGIGDTLTIRFTLKLDGVNTNLSQSIGGDNYVLIVDSGRIPTSGYWNELHPRTGYGMSQTTDTAIFCVVDGRGKSAGCTTRVLGEIMAHFGAWRAVNWDGGGSSSMYIRQIANQVNMGSDGTERAVGNAMFAVANLPEEDNVVAKILPRKSIVLLPRYGIYKPQILAYNQYGLLLSGDLQGCRLSCDASVGDIVDDSFLASGPDGGILHVSYNGVSCDIQIDMLNGAAPRFALDSLLIDNRHHYKVVVAAVAGEQTLELENKALAWTSTSEDVCVVSADGVVQSVSDGQAQVVGSVGDFSDTLLVNVENAASPHEHVSLYLDSIWKLSSSSGFNPVLTVDNSRLKVGYSYSITRSPFLQMECRQRLYGLPDSIGFRLLTTAKLDNVTIGLRQDKVRLTELVKKSISPLPVGKDTFLCFSLSDVLDTDDLSVFPVNLNTLRFAINSSNQAGNYHILLSDFTLIYKGMQITMIDNVQNADIHVYPNPACDKISIEGVSQGDDISLYDLSGKTIYRQVADTGIHHISLVHFPIGTYLLKINNYSVKLFKQ